MDDVADGSSLWLKTALCSVHLMLNSFRPVYPWPLGMESR